MSITTEVIVSYCRSPILLIWNSPYGFSLRIEKQRDKLCFLPLLPFSISYHTNYASAFRYHLGFGKSERLRPQFHRTTVSPNKEIQKGTSVYCLAILLVTPVRWVWGVICNVTGVICMEIHHGPLQPGGCTLAVKLTLVFKQLQNSI